MGSIFQFSFGRSRLRRPPGQPPERPVAHAPKPRVGFVSHAAHSPKNRIPKNRTILEPSIWVRSFNPHHRLVHKDARVPRIGRTQLPYLLSPTMRVYRRRSAAQQRTRNRTIYPVTPPTPPIWLRFFNAFSAIRAEICTSEKSPPRTSHRHNPKKLQLLRQDWLRFAESCTVRRFIAECTKKHNPLTPQRPALRPLPVLFAFIRGPILHPPNPHRITKNRPIYPVTSPNPLQAGFVFSPNASPPACTKKHNPPKFAFIGVHLRPLFPPCPPTAL